MVELEAGKPTKSCRRCCTRRVAVWPWMTESDMVRHCEVWSLGVQVDVECMRTLVWQIS